MYLISSEFNRPELMHIMIDRYTKSGGENNNTLVNVVNVELLIYCRLYNDVIKKTLDMINSN